MGARATSGDGRREPLLFLLCLFFRPTPSVYAARKRASLSLSRPPFPLHSLASSDSCCCIPLPGFPSPPSHLRARVPSPSFLLPLPPSCVPINTWRRREKESSLLPPSKVLYYTCPLSPSLLRMHSCALRSKETRPLRPPRRGRQTACSPVALATEGSSKKVPFLLPHSSPLERRNGGRCVGRGKRDIGAFILRGPTS